jgi:hypothetical protein
VELVRQSDLVEDFHDRGMNRVAPEFAVEILVHFEKRDRDSVPCEQKSEYGSAWPATGNATGSLLTVDDFGASSLYFNGIEKLRRQGFLLGGEISGKASDAIETAIRNWSSRRHASHCANSS